MQVTPLASVVALIQDVQHGQRMAATLRSQGQPARPASSGEVLSGLPRNFSWIS